MTEASASRAAHHDVQSTIPGVTLKARWMGVKARLHTLVITHDRLLFIRSTSADLKRVSAALRQEAKHAGRGRLAQLGAQMQAHEVLAQEFAGLDPSELLANHPKNFAVDLNTVSKVKIRTVEAPNALTEDQLTIKTTGKTYKMVLTGATIARAQQALMTAGLL